MEKEKKNWKDTVKETTIAVKNKAGGFADIAADKSDDAKKQLAAVADDLANNAQKGGKVAAVKLNEAKIAFDKKRFNPVFQEEFISKNYDMPNLILLRNSDPHPNVPACEGAIGYRPTFGKTPVLELIKGEIGEQRLTFFPDLIASMYYRNPYVENMYITLDEYFDYIKKERVNELVNIAHSLGAKYVKIVFKEEKKAFVSAVVDKKEKQKIKGSEGYENKAGLDLKAHNLCELEVASEMTFEGNDQPERPKLIYFKNDTDIENLIDMCIEKKNPPKTKSYTIKYHKSKDIDLKMSENIDFVLKKLSMAGTASIRSEAEKEDRMYMEYHIQF